MQRAVRAALCGALRAPPCRGFRAAAPQLAGRREPGEREELREAGHREELREQGHRQELREPGQRELRELLLQLRRKTGLPFLQCREALQRCGGDVRQAEAWLGEEAERRGWSRSEALGLRSAREGLVGLLRDGAAAAIVEVNCESDFVARTQEFQELVALAALGTLSHCRGAALSPPTPCAMHQLQAEELRQLRAGPGAELLSAHLARLTGRLGEKLALRRAAWLRVPEQGGFIGTYAHGHGAGGCPVATGTYGALVAFGVPTPQTPLPPEAKLEELGTMVAQHVVGMAPTSVGTPRELAPEGGEGQEESRLLAQSFLLQPELSVGQFLGHRGGGLQVHGFLRFQRGEEVAQDAQKDAQKDAPKGALGDAPRPPG